jgi:hypothetical protein
MQNASVSRIARSYCITDCEPGQYYVAAADTASSSLKVVASQFLSLAYRSNKQRAYSDTEKIVKKGNKEYFGKFGQEGGSEQNEAKRERTRTRTFYSG